MKFLTFEELSICSDRDLEKSRLMICCEQQRRQISTVTMHTDNGPVRKSFTGPVAWWLAALAGIEVEYRLGNQEWQQLDPAVREPAGSEFRYKPQASDA